MLCMCCLLHICFTSNPRSIFQCCILLSLSLQLLHWIPFHASPSYSRPQMLQSYCLMGGSNYYRYPKKKATSTIESTRILSFSTNPHFILWARIFDQRFGNATALISCHTNWEFIFSIPSIFNCCHGSGNNTKAIFLGKNTNKKKIANTEM